jgi:chromosome segregation ATPase
MQFKDLVSIRNANDYVFNLRREIYKDFKFISNNKTQIEKLFILIKDLKDDNLAQAQRNEELARKVSLLENQAKSARYANEGLNREVKFISEQVKRLGNDKLKLEKRLNELERNKSHEDSCNSPTGKRTTDTRPLQRTNAKLLSPNPIEIIDPEKSVSIL